MKRTGPLSVRVEVPVTPEPGLLRPAIERRLEGGAFPTGPEDAVGKAVAEALDAHEQETRTWR
jgi:hypothetical protein